MKMTSLALASTLVAAVLSAQPVLAQTQVVPGTDSPASSENGVGIRNGGAATGGDNQSAQHDGNWRSRSTQESPGTRLGERGWRHGGRFSQDEGRDMRRRIIERHREMMGMGGPRIRLSRGNARIDVQCGPNDGMKVCAEAAAELLEKVAGMHRKQQGATSGSAVTPPSGSDESGQAPDTNNEDEEQNLDSNPTPNSSGDRM